MESKQFCTSCGKEIPGDAAYCPNCGAKLNHEESYGAGTNFYGDQNMGGMYSNQYQSSYDPNGSKKAQGMMDDSDSQGTIALILGIFSIFIPFANTVTSIVAIVIGSKSFKDTKGKIGLILGIIGLLIAVVEIIFGIRYAINIVNQVMDEMERNSGNFDIRINI